VSRWVGRWVWTSMIIVGVPEWRALKAGADGSVRLERAFRNVMIAEFMDAVWEMKNLSVTPLPLPADRVCRSGSSTSWSRAIIHLGIFLGGRQTQCFAQCPVGTKPIREMSCLKLPPMANLPHQAAHAVSVQGSRSMWIRVRARKGTETN
jgi:hypothetical protein